MGEIIVYLHLLSTFMLTGVTWLVQVLVYPQLFLVPYNVFVDYEKKHQERISYVVVPLMLCELMTCAALLLSSLSLFWLTNFFLVALIWLSTFFVQAPLHNKLTIKKDQQIIRKLIYTHSIRTLIWNVRACLLYCLCAS